MIDIISDLNPVFIILFLVILLFSFLGIAFKGEFAKIEEEKKFLNNLFVTFDRKEDENVFFVCHELKKMYYIALDEYDYKHTQIEEKYKLNYVEEGWGRHNIIHNGKTYKLYEI